ncbi:methionyl-tRNA formyltransferase [Albibacterium sp.]|uniref:methionyl-tRNA formyltransferase n=1 Tax=Albibacterium sp. TaxID=2952885 RepID=UPI002BEBAB57|nr:methionyl-tRNA formyltransferase [Albibacterium sp.]HUH18498.1 methionyl-tRNA formyltransferase [Albibacterium sp.]
MSIIFMGTPEFAVASLQALLDAGEKIVAVVTAPDKPAGRGQKIHESAVKKFALANHLPVLQPTNLKDPDFIKQLENFKADLQVVVAFRMLPEIVWNMPPKGTINLHASLLPQYRGAAPINHAIINGETETGVSTFLLQHEIDTGNVLFSEKTSILPNDTAEDLHDKLMNIGAQLLVKTVSSIYRGQVEGIPQSENNEQLKTAPKIHKEDCRINWDRSVQEVYNLIRGLSPYPTAFTLLDNKILKIYKAKPEFTQVNEIPGTPLSDGKTYLKFACKNGYIHIQDLQIQDKKRMGISDFLRGFRLK